MRALFVAALVACCSSAVQLQQPQQLIAPRFSDATARDEMLPISSAAYSDAPQACLTTQLKTATLSKQVTLKCDGFRKDKCSGFTFFDESRKIIGISFRGTTDATQFVEELVDTAFESKVDFPDGGKTSKYFEDAFKDVWDGGLEKDFTALVAKYSTFTAWITGHSLGGALASLAAAHISSTQILPKEKILLYTFGQPRTGDKVYANVHDDLVTSFRVTHSKDIVVHTPPQFSNYEHHTSEVWYDNDMEEGASYIVCGKQEDKRCSDRHIFNTSPDDHHHYYGRDVSSWGDNGCPN